MTTAKAPPKKRTRKAVSRKTNAEKAHKLHALSVYHPRYALAMEKYFARKDGIEVAQRSKGAHKTTSKVSRISPDFPTMAGFALTIGVTKQTLSNWAATVDDKGQPAHPEFAIAYERALYHQERLLINETLKGGYQPYFANMVAMNILKWTTRADSKVSTPPGEALVVREEYSATAALQRTRELLGALADGGHG